MSKIEEVEGKRWAREVCLSVRETVRNWRESLLATLERGLVEKPEGYKIGVQHYIDLVRSAPDSLPEQSKYAKNE